MGKIPAEELSSLVERAQSRVEEQVKYVRATEGGLVYSARKYARIANVVRFIIILFSSFLATRVIADSMTGNQKQAPLSTSTGEQGLARSPSAGRVSVVIIYTLVSVVLAILGGIDAAYKPRESSSELTFLRVRCNRLVGETEYRWAVGVERLGTSEEALDNANTLFDRLVQERCQIDDRLAELGVHVDRTLGIT